jgi:hypothetical protein
MTAPKPADDARFFGCHDRASFGGSTAADRVGFDRVMPMTRASIRRRGALRRLRQRATISLVLTSAVAFVLMVMAG